MGRLLLLLFVGFASPSSEVSVLQCRIIEKFNKNVEFTLGLKYFEVGWLNDDTWAKLNFWWFQMVAEVTEAISVIRLGVDLVRIFFCFLAILKENENWQQITQLIAASTIFFQRHNYRIIATQDRYKNHWKLSWASLQVKYIGTVAGEFCDESQGDCTVNVDLDMVLVLSFISWSILNERISHPLVQLKSPSSSSSSLSLSSWFQSWKHNSCFFFFRPEERSCYWKCIQTWWTPWRHFEHIHWNYFPLFKFYQIPPGDYRANWSCPGLSGTSSGCLLLD